MLDPQEEQTSNPLKVPGATGGSNSHIWLITFTDIMALMLAFFVLLFSMAQPKQAAWTEMRTAFDAELNNATSGNNAAGQHATENVDRVNWDRALDLDYLSALLHRQLEEYPELGEAQITTYDTKIVITLPSQLLFNAGRAEINEDGKKAIYHLASRFRSMINRIEINGHTDPSPMNTPQYRSNWDLSLDRAINVAALLYENGYTRNITVQGLADSAYDKIPANLPPDERYAKARRVEIIIREHKPPKIWNF